jgi:hypothetical protein
LSSSLYVWIVGRSGAHTVADALRGRFGISCRQSRLARANKSSVSSIKFTFPSNCELPSRRQPQIPNLQTGCCRKSI